MLNSLTTRGLLQSLQFRLVLGFALVLAIAIASVSAYAAAVTRAETERFAREVEEARAERVQRLVSDVYEASQNWDQVRYTVGQAARLLGWRVVIQDELGQVLVDSHADPVATEIEQSQSAFSAAFPFQSRTYRRAVLFGNEQLGMFMVVEQDEPRYPQVGPGFGGFFDGSGRDRPRPDESGNEVIPFSQTDFALTTQTPTDVTIERAIVGNEEAIAQQLAPEPRLSDLESSFRRSLLLAGASAGLAGIIFVGMFTRQALAPVRGLTGAARRFGKGDLSYRVPEKRRDEVGELARTFNEMASELEKAASQRKAMTADIAHELRTPLTNIKGYLEAIKDGVVAPDKQTIDIIYDQTVHLARLVEDLRLLAIADAGRLALDLQPESLENLTESAVAAFRSRAAARNVALVVIAPSPTPQVNVDRTRIRQVIANLVENALTHTPEGGSVTVSVDTPTALTVRLIVADTGVGIPTEHLAHIFDQFYRVDQSRSRSTGGAGLGLTIVKRLVDAHGGTIHASSEPGLGTRFVVQLPASTAAIP